MGSGGQKKSLTLSAGRMEMIGGGEMFCTKCGERNEEGTKFCVRCGEPLTPRRAPGFTDGRKMTGKAGPGSFRAETPVLQKRGKKKVIAVLLVVVIAVIAFFLLNGRSTDALVKKYVEAGLDGDVETIWNLLPEQMQEIVLEEAEDEMNLYGEEEVVSYLEDEIKDIWDTARSQAGGDFDVNWEIIDEKEYSKTELRELNQQMREGGLHGFTADDAKDVNVEMSVAAGEKSGSSSMSITLVKQGHKWYLGDLNLHGFRL